MIAECNPKRFQLRSRTAYESASPCPSAETARSELAATVTTRGPNRSLSNPTGTESASIAIAGAATTSPASNTERSKRVVYVGISGTSAMPSAATSRWNAYRNTTVRRIGGSVRDQAARHVHGLARHVRRGVGEQKDDHLGHLARRSHPAERNARDAAPRELVGIDAAEWSNASEDDVVHRRVDDARTHRVYTDAPRSPRVREAPSQRQHRRLRRAVDGSLVRRAGLAGAGRHVDDRAAVGHLCAERLRQEEERPRIDAHDRVPVVLADLLDPGQPDDPR